jgi:hypothetical protein
VSGHFEHSASPPAPTADKLRVESQLNTIVQTYGIDLCVQLSTHALMLNKQDNSTLIK